MKHTHYLSLLPLLHSVWASSALSLPPTTPSVPRAVQGPPANASDVVASAWYPGWRINEFPLDMIPWSSYNNIKYAFAITTPNTSMATLLPREDQNLRQLVQAGHQNDTFVSLSIGGWTGSQYFSNAVATASNRTAFVATCVAFVQQFNLDGLDFDWEYPNAAGVGCNAMSPSDAANFLLFLQELRADPTASNIILSAAVPVKPWLGASGTPSTDVSGFAAVLDYIEIMNYDVWGPWSTSVGPNAPLDDSCSSYQEGSAMSAVAAWTAAGFPANQIVLGVASYGHSFFVPSASAMTGSTLNVYAPFDKSMQPHGDSWDDPAGTDQCGNPAPVGGIFNFWGLIQAGFLTADGMAAPGINYFYDNCSQTPFVYNPQTQVMVSYDDAQSFAAKGHYIDSAGLKGFAVWDVAGDQNNILLNSISGAMGVESDC